MAALVFALTPAPSPGLPGIGGCLTALRSFFAGRRQSPESRLHVGLDADGHLVDPLAFRSAHARSLLAGADVLPLPPYREALARLRALSAGTAPPGTAPAPPSGGPLSLRAYARVFLREAATYSRRVTGHYGDPSLSQVEHAEAIVGEIVRAGGVVLPVVRDAPFTKLELLRASAAGVFLVQLPSQPTFADKVRLSPFGFLYHDLGHSLAMVQGMSGFWASPSRFRRVVRRLSRLVERIPEIPDARFREDVTAFLFDCVHENPTFELDRPRDFAGRIRRIAASEAAETFGQIWFEGIPGGPGVSARSRMGAVADWLESLP